MIRISYCTYLGWFHIKDLGDPPLHNQEVWIVHIELHRAKQVLYSRRRGITAVDQILVASSNHNLREKHDIKVEPFYL